MPVKFDAPATIPIVTPATVLEESLPYCKNLIFEIFTLLTVIKPK